MTCDYCGETFRSGRPVDWRSCPANPVILHPVLRRLPPRKLVQRPGDGVDELFRAAVRLGRRIIDAFRPVV